MFNASSEITDFEFKINARKIRKVKDRFEIFDHCIQPRLLFHGCVFPLLFFFPLPLPFFPTFLPLFCAAVKGE